MKPRLSYHAWRVTNSATVQVVIIVGLCTLLAALVGFLAWLFVEAMDAYHASGKVVQLQSQVKELEGVLNGQIVLMEDGGRKYAEVRWHELVER